uniref:Uncharacterized protein n=1 Tax=Panagrolaimus sp. ES5 TaxID=591445 RepID=A0AC34GC54_9BILA
MFYLKSLEDQKNGSIKTLTFGEEPDFSVGGEIIGEIIPSFFVAVAAAGADSGVVGSELVSDDVGVRDVGAEDVEVDVEGGVGVVIVSEDVEDVEAEADGEADGAADEEEDDARAIASFKVEIFFAVVVVADEVDGADGGLFATARLAAPFLED